MKLIIGKQELRKAVIFLVILFVSFADGKARAQLLLQPTNSIVLRVSEVNDPTTNRFYRTIGYSSVFFPELSHTLPINPNTLDLKKLSSWIGEVRAEGRDINLIISSTLLEKLGEAFQSTLMQNPLLPGNLLKIVLQKHVFNARNNSAKKGHNSDTIAYHGLVHDRGLGLVFIDGVSVHLSATEYSLFHLLESNQGQVLSKEDILEKVWPESYDEVSERIVKNYIKHLRVRLGATYSKLIANNRGHGYLFDTDALNTNKEVLFSNHTDTRDFGGVVIDASAKKLFVDGVEIRVSAIQYRILDYLTAKPNVIRTYDQIVEKSWDDWAITRSRGAVSTHIHEIRKAFGKKYKKKLKTVSGVGYVFESKK